jgi:uncharacterized protein involved in exopolysaccharide biosynthesis
MELPKYPVPPPKRRQVKPATGWFPSPAPREAARDLRDAFRGMDRRRWLFLALAVVLTVVTMFGFLLDSDIRNLGLKTQVIYVESWRADRTDAEIAAQQQRDLVLKREAEARRQEQYKRLEEKLGI